MRGMWHACAPDAGGCIIKGNLDRDDKRYYHMPDSLSYNQVSINLDKRDRWFCTEDEAIKAGFVKALR